MRGGFMSAAAAGIIGWAAASQLPPVPQSPSAPPARYEIRINARRLTPAAEAPRWTSLFADASASRVHAIVQLAELPTVQTRMALQRQGIVLGQPLTGQAYLATVTRASLPATGAAPGIRWVGPVNAGDKLSPALTQSDDGIWARRNPGRVDVLVKLFGDGDMQRAAARVQQIGGTLLGQSTAARSIAGSLPAGRESELAALDDVRFIEPLLPPGTSESDRVRQHVNTFVSAIPSGEATGRGVTVGVFDFRHADVTHPDLVGRAQLGDVTLGTFDGHPTMTAGMIAGDGSSSQAQPGTGPGLRSASAGQWRGIAPAASIRTYNYTDSGDSITNYLNDVTDAVMNDGVVIANNSWGDSGCTIAYGAYAGRAPFLDGVVHGDLGRRMTIVFSAGNERDGFGSPEDLSCVPNTTAPFANYTTVNHPKAAKNVLVVGAVDSLNNAMTSYSSWGPTLDGRLKPEVVASGHHNGAPNAGITSITVPFGIPTGAANQQDYRVPFSPRTSFWYGWFSQTSNAAAVVSGALALLVDAWRAKYGPAIEPLPSTLRALLVQHAVDISDATAWYNRGPDFASGYGLIDINNTLAGLRRGDARQGLIDVNGVEHITAQVAPGTTTVRFTLAWDDPPAADGASPALINDLDLVVTDPNGVRHYPWTLNAATPSGDAVRTAEDHVNNIEQVFVDAGVVAGTWKIDVRATTIMQGPQTFSVVGRGVSAPNAPTNLRITGLDRF